jgi:hypothetical protein
MNDLGWHFLDTSLAHVVAAHLLEILVKIINFMNLEIKLLIHLDCFALVEKQELKKIEKFL